MSVSGKENSAMSALDKQRERILKNQRARRGASMQQGGGMSPRKPQGRGSREKRLGSLGDSSSTDPEPVSPRKQPSSQPHEMEEMTLEWVQTQGTPRHVGTVPRSPASPGSDSIESDDVPVQKIHKPLEPRRKSSHDAGPTAEQMKLASTLDSQGIGVVFQPTAEGGPGRSSTGAEFYNSEAARKRSSGNSQPRSAPPPYDDIVGSSDPAAIARATPIEEESPEAAAAAAASSPPPLVRMGAAGVREGLQFGTEGYPSLLEFVSRPTPEGLTVQCEISRSKARKSTYILKLERPEAGGVKKVFLLAGKKRNRAGAKSNYLISCDPTDMTKESDAYCAKVKANILGTEFTIYDSGLNPKKAEKGRQSKDFKDVRKELGMVKYDRNVFGWSGPRQMAIILPALNEHQIPYVVQPKSQRDTISTKFEHGRTTDLLQFANKVPQWKDSASGEYQAPSGKEPKGSYVLDFGGRVTEPSIKNFQVIFGDELDYIVCQFGRTGKDTFTMDVNYPMSIIQAFGICLTSFDWKPGCE